ncbi:VOC family protein [Acidipila sp. EB88]|uniref:VOC family protein n=1 Tax=Acidipila sp. EB88 TaxID=2305226 RepID=UPI000F5E975A|nr:VOC family protein [Acidipila sp. EB88]RRA49927.1 VOC family protein [Acidipila sp. EB88]
MAFAIESLDHLVLTVHSISATTDFYSEVLGMDVVTFNGRKALAFGEQRINLHQHGHEFAPFAAHPTPGSGDLCFITSTPLEEVIEYLDQLRIHVEMGPVERTGAQSQLRSLYIRDPDRNLVEISNFI